MSAPLVSDLLLSEGLMLRLIFFEHLSDSAVLLLVEYLYPCQFIFNNNKIGHIDHGKTTLTAAITKYLANKGKPFRRKTSPKHVEIISYTLRTIE